MQKYYSAVFVIIAAFACLMRGGKYISQPRAIEFGSFLNGSEARLAIGQTLNYWDAGMYELELIPKISDKLARRMLLSKAEIHARASTLTEAEKYQALEVVKGIGRKTSKRLSRYVTLTSPASPAASSR